MGQVRPPAKQLITTMGTMENRDLAVSQAITWLDVATPLDKHQDRVAVAGSLGDLLGSLIPRPVDQGASLDTTRILTPARQLMKILLRPGEPAPVRLAVARILGEQVPGSLGPAGASDAQKEKLGRGLYEMLEKGLSSKEPAGRMACVFGLARLAQVLLYDEIVDRLYEQSLSDEDDQAAMFADHCYEQVRDKGFQIETEEYFNPAPTELPS